MGLAGHFVWDWAVKYVGIMQEYSKIDTGWIFKYKWPKNVTITENCKQYISGTRVIGFETKSFIAKEKEWFLLNSHYKNSGSHNLNRTIA